MKSIRVTKAEAEFIYEKVSDLKVLAITARNPDLVQDSNIILDILVEKLLGAREEES